MNRNTFNADQFGVLVRKAYFGIQWPFVSSRISSKDIYCSNLGNTGFGDTILDIISLRTICEMKHRKSKLHVYWRKREKGRVYDTSLFQLPNVHIIDDLADSFPDSVEVDFSENSVLYKSIDGERDVICLDLNSGYFGTGTLSPSRIVDNFQKFGFRNTPAISAVQARFLDIAQQLVFKKDILSKIQRDIGNRVSVHIRRTDKLTSRENEFSMTKNNWDYIERKALNEIYALVKHNVPIYLSSDDKDYEHRLFTKLVNAGGNIARFVPHEVGVSDPGMVDLIDFAALSRSRAIVQMTKYSTFSMAASLLNGTPLINYFGEGEDEQNLIRIWSDCLDRRFSVFDCDLSS